MPETQTFKELHLDKGTMLRLPCAWDSLSAKLLERSGAKAIGSTSAGMSWSRGHADGGHLSIDALMHFASRLVASVTVPVSLDIEHGYGFPPGDLARRLADIGVAGVNIEDSEAGELRSIENACSKIEAFSSSDTGIFLNARIDTFLLRSASDPEEVLDATVDRALRLLTAGADAIFVPGLDDLSLIEQLVQRIDAPLNIMVNSDSDLDALDAVGVRRVSSGPGLAIDAANALIERSKQFLGVSDATSIGFGDLQALFEQDE